MANINSFSPIKIIDMCLSYSQENLEKELLKAYKELSASTGTITAQMLEDKVKTLEYIIRERFIL